MRALDLFCGAGGSSMGLHRAGFDVTGIDIARQRHYPFPFIQADALMPPVDLSQFDLIWASPPCQAFSTASGGRGARHPNLIPQTRALLSQSGARWTVIENVRGAPIRADIVLDGTIFPELRVVRRRHFETNFGTAVALGFPSYKLVSRHGWTTPTGSDNSSHTRAARAKNGMKIRDSHVDRAAGMNHAYPVSTHDHYS